MALGFLTPAAWAQTSEGKTVWDGVYTDAQASRGMTVFGQSCAGCHALAEVGKAPLVGEAFWKSFSQKTVAELLEFVTANMPNGSPGSLSPASYQDIVAVMLKSNGFPAGKAELDPGTIGDVQIVPRDRSTELPANAFVRVIGCLERVGTDWVVMNATNPERAERTDDLDASTKALGAKTIPLKFVLTKLDSLQGARVAVTGLLMGAGGSEGINVTTVNRVALTCP